MTDVRVLLVDDEQEFTNTVAERLEIRGFDVEVAYDGATALEIVRVHSPQVMILDLRMPGLSGIDVLKRMKSDHPGIPVILLTGFGSEADGMAGVQLGACDFLMKPIEIKALIDKIHEAIQSAR